MRHEKRRPVRFLAVLLCAMAVFLAATTAALFISAQKTERVLEGNLTAQAEKAKEEQVNILRNIFYTSRNILGNVMYDTEIYKILKYTTTTDAQAIRTMRNRLRLSQTIHLNDISYRIVLLDMNGHMYSNWMRGAEFYAEIMSQPALQAAVAGGASSFLFRHGFWYTDDENPVERVPAVSFGSVVLDQYASTPIGILLFSAEERSLLTALESGAVRVAVSDAGTGERLCGSVDAALFDETRKDPERFPLDTIVRLTWQGEQKLVCRSRIASSSIELLQVMDFAEVYRELIGLQRGNILLALLMLAALSAVLLAAVFTVARPLRKLYRQVCALNVSPEGAIPRIDAAGYRECAEVAEAINDMSERTMEMVRVIRRQQRDQAELKYQYLLSQLDPHFLLNTLNNVKWTAYMSSAPRVAEMITALGFLLETSLGKNQGEVTIDYEINHVRNYMLLQSMHFGEEITYAVDADADTLALPFERFTLQTLVGNAIKHGFVKGKPMRIGIRVARQGGDLAITVQDDGCGMTPEKLEQVREEIRASESSERSGHIGLRNLCQRLSYRYGAGARMTVDSVAGEMTRVELRVKLTEPPTGGLEGRNPPKSIPNPATCAVDSVALRSKVSLQPTPPGASRRDA